MSMFDNPTPPADSPIDWDSVRDEVALSLVEEAKAYLVGDFSDMQQFAAQLSADITQALQQGRPDLVSEMKGQLTARLEISRLRASAAAMGSVKRTLDNLTGIAFKIMGVM